MERIAVIGLGSIATRHRRNLKHILPNSILYAMSSRGIIPEDKVNYCDFTFTNITQLLEVKPEMVVVASPSPYHAEHAIPFIEAGIPTFIEKPVVATVDDLHKLQLSVKKSGTPVAVGYCLRYLPSSVKMKTLITSNLIGDIYNAFVQVGQYLPDWRPNQYYRDSVSAKKQLGGGALLELSHELDYAQWLLGELSVEYAALRSSKELDLNVEDIVDLMLTNKSGIICNIHLDFLQRPAQRTCSFLGIKGRLDWDLIQNKIIFTNNNFTQVLYNEPLWDKNLMYINMLNDFVSMINGKKNQCVDLDSAAVTIQLINQIKVNRG